MKIIHLITSLQLGGTEKFLRTLAQHQAQSHQVLIAYMKEDGITGTLLRHDGFPVYQTPTLGELYTFLKKHQCDILHTHMFRANIIGRIAGAWAHVPLIIASQHAIDAWKKPWHWWMETLTSRWVQCIIANSLAAQEQLIRCGKIDPKKIRIIPIGFDAKSICLTKSKNDIYDELHIPANKKLALYIGRLHHEKGSHYLPDIIESAVALDASVFFLIIGYGQLKQDIEKRIAAKHLNQYVTILDARLDIFNILNASTVFFLPSLEESFSNAALEAMAAGKPVIITDVGGNKELVLSGVDGILIPPKDTKTMAEKIVEICRDESLAALLGAQAQKKAALFSMEETLRKIDEVYASFRKE